MLAVVLLVVLATVQVECAPNQLWPSFEKVAAQPTKKPIFASSIAKETTSKAPVNPYATQHAYEQFINTWLRQASLTLNRPDLLRLITSALASEPEASSQPSVGDSAVQEPVAPVAVFDSQVVPVEEIVAPGTEEPLLSESAVETIPGELEPVPIDSTPETSFVTVADPVEIVPETNESPFDAVLFDETAEPVFPSEDTVVAAVPVDSLIPPKEDVIPSLVEQDSATVLVATPSTSLTEPEMISEVAAEPIPFSVAESQPEELLQPETPVEAQPSFATPEPEMAFPSGKSFTSIQSTENVIPQEQSIPIATFFPTVHSPEVAAAPSSQSPIPTFATVFPVAPLPAFRSPGAVTTDGLAYTLQFFPSRGRSHYFVSTAVGS